MTHIKDQIIAVRFSKDERKLIEIYAKNRNYTLTDFVRKAVLAYMNELKNNVGILNPDEINDTLKTIENSADLILEKIKLLGNIFEFDNIEESDKASYINSTIEKMTNI